MTSLIHVALLALHRLPSAIHYAALPRNHVLNRDIDHKANCPTSSRQIPAPYENMLRPSSVHRPPYILIIETFQSGACPLPDASVQRRLHRLSFDATDWDVCTACRRLTAVVGPAKAEVVSPPDS